MVLIVGFGLRSDWTLVLNWSVNGAAGQFYTPLLTTSAIGNQLRRRVHESESSHTMTRWTPLTLLRMHMISANDMLRIGTDRIGSDRSIGGEIKRLCWTPSERLCWRTSSTPTLSLCYNNQSAWNL